MKWMWLLVLIVLNLLILLIIFIQTNVVHAPKPTELKGVDYGTTNTEKSEYTGNQKFSR